MTERERMGRRADDTLQRKMSRQRDRYTRDDDDGWMDVIHGQVDDGRMDINDAWMGGHTVTDSHVLN